METFPPEGLGPFIDYSDLAQTLGPKDWENTLRDYVQLYKAAAKEITPQDQKRGLRHYASLVGADPKKFFPKKTKTFPPSGIKVEELTQREREHILREYVHLRNDAAKQLTPQERESVFLHHAQRLPGGSLLPMTRKVEGETKVDPSTVGRSSKDNYSLFFEEGSEAELQTVSERFVAALKEGDSNARSVVKFLFRLTSPMALDQIPDGARIPDGLRTSNGVQMELFFLFIEERLAVSCEINFFLWNHYFRRWYKSNTKESPKEGVQEVAELLAPIQKGILAKSSNYTIEREMQRALTLKNRPGVWGTNKNTGTKFCDTPSGTITYRPEEVFEIWYEEQYEAALKALEAKFANIKSDITVDVIDILFHHWNTYPYPKKHNKAHITMAQLCEYRDVKPTGDNLKNIWEAMRTARSIRLKSDGIDAALFDMDAARASQLNLFGLEAPAKADTVFVYSPGFFLAGAIESNPTYFAPYLQKLWQLNPKSQSVTKRLARYLRGEWRQNTYRYMQPDGSPVELPNRFSTWAQILDSAGVDVEEWRHGKDPMRLTSAVENALAELYEMGFIERCDATIYEDPDLLKGLRRKGFLAAWLALRIHIVPSTQIREALRDTNAKRIRRAALQEERLKQLPKAKGKRRKKDA